MPSIPDLSITQAQPEDLEAVMVLLEEARQWLIQNGIPEQWPTPHPPSVFAERIHQGQLYIARRNMILIGTFSLLWSDPQVWDTIPEDAGYVHGMAVRRSVAGQGIGVKLLNAAANIIERTGRAYLRLDCWAGNPKLCAYYEHLGFQRRGTKDLGQGFIVQRYERIVAFPF